MRFRSPIHWWPLLVVALVAGCDDDKTPSGPGGAGGSGGTAVQDSGADTTTGGGGSAGTGGAAGKGGSGGAPTDGGAPPSDGGLVPCPLGQPNDLDRPPSGSLPCELLPPGFVAP